MGSGRRGRVVRGWTWSGSQTKRTAGRCRWYSTTGVYDLHRMWTILTPLRHGSAGYECSWGSADIAICLLEGALYGKTNGN